MAGPPATGTQPPARVLCRDSLLPRCPAGALSASPPPTPPARLHSRYPSAPLAPARTKARFSAQKTAPTLTK